MERERVKKEGEGEGEGEETEMGEYERIERKFEKKKKRIKILAFMSVPFQTHAKVFRI